MLSLPSSHFGLGGFSAAQSLNYDSFADQEEVATTPLDNRTNTLSLNMNMNNSYGFLPNALDLNDKYAAERRSLAGFGLGAGLEDNGNTFFGFRVPEDAPSPSAQPEIQPQQPLPPSQPQDLELEEVQVRPPSAQLRVPQTPSLELPVAQAQPIQEQQTQTPQTQVQIPAEGEQQPGLYPSGEFEEQTLDTFSPNLDQLESFEGKIEQDHETNWEGWDDLLHDEVQPGSALDLDHKPNFGSLEELVPSNSSSFTLPSLLRQSSGEEGSISLMMRMVSASTPSSASAAASASASSSFLVEKETPSPSSPSSPELVRRGRGRPTAAARELARKMSKKNKQQQQKMKRVPKKYTLPQKPQRPGELTPAELPAFYTRKPETREQNWQIERKKKLERFRQRRSDTMSKKVLYPIRQRFANHRPRVGGRFIKLKGGVVAGNDQEVLIQHSDQRSESVVANNVSSLNITHQLNLMAPVA